MLKVKDYVKINKVSSIEKDMNEAFIEYIERKNFVKYYPQIDSRFFMIKLKVRFFSHEKIPSIIEIYDELTNLCLDNDLNHIGFHKLELSPPIICQEYKGEVRGVFAQIKYVA